VSGIRRLYLDRSPGERRGVALLDGRPERLLIERDGEPPRARLGERRLGRVAAIERATNLAFVDLGEGLAGVLKLTGASAALTVGAAVEVDVRSEAHERGKGCGLALVGAGGGPPALSRPAPDLVERLQAFAPDQPIVEGERAREAADAAEDAALDPVFALETGERITIEPTRALVAVDLDWSETAAAGARRADRANRRALPEIARLLRLKGLAGTIVIDLIGFGEGREGLHAAAKAAFAADGARVLAPTPLGLLQIAKPRAETPVALRLLAEDGRLSARSVARRLARALEREGRADPGVRLEAVAAPDVAAELRPLATALGPRFSVAEEVGRDRLATDIRAR
jgi:Ribonuclease G/E